MATALWRTRRVLAFESGTALERDNTQGPLLDLQRSLEIGSPRNPEALDHGRVLARALAPPDAVALAMAMAHLTREVGRLSHAS